MSNRRKLTPPPAVRRYAKTVRCTDCHSETGKPWLDEHGMWHVALRHDAWCPVLNGHVSPAQIHANTEPRKGTNR